MHSWGIIISICMRLIKEKTTFITDQGIYCYKVMSFGLKNVGATYQTMVNKMPINLIGRNMEVYVNTNLVKSN